MVPYIYLNKISGLIAEVENNVIEAQIDIELNSLEDAFIKITEADIKTEESKSKFNFQKDLNMSEQEE